MYAALSFQTTALPMLALVEDAPARARAELAEAQPQLPANTFRTQHYFAFLSELRVDLYEGLGSQAWQRVETTWPLIRRSLILHIEAARLLVFEHRGRCALAAAAQGGADAEGLLREAERVALRLGKERVAAAWAVAAMLRACVADARGRRAETLELLAEAEQRCAEQDLGLHLAAVRRRRGELLGSTEGATLVAAADEWLASQGVRAPERFCGMMYPVRR